MDLHGDSNNEVKRFTRRTNAGSTSSASPSDRNAGQPSEITRKPKCGKKMSLATGKLRQTNVDQGIARHARVVANAADPFATPKRFLIRNGGDDINGFAHPPIITECSCSPKRGLSWASLRAVAFDVASDTRLSRANPVQAARDNTKSSGAA